MADKSVGELIAAQSVTPTDLFVLEQNGTAKKLTAQILENWLLSLADGHGLIQSITKLKTNGLVDTYRITLSDETTFDYFVTNGKGILSFIKTGTNGLVDSYEISYNDGTSGTFTVTNGEKGNPGSPGYLWVKYSSEMPTEESHFMGDLPDNYIGICPGNQTSAPSDWKEYTWYQWKGAQGDKGDKGQRGFSIFNAYIESEGNTDTEIVPSLIDTKGENLMVGDMLLAPSGNLYKVKSLPTADRYLVGASYFTSLLGPQGLIPEYFDHIILKSSTENSFKKFKLTVDDSGEMSIEEITKIGTITITDPYGWENCFTGTLNFVVGMTWQQFCESEYNTPGFVIENNVVHHITGPYLFHESGPSGYFSAEANDEIIDGQEYSWDF